MEAWLNIYRLERFYLWVKDDYMYTFFGDERKVGGFLSIVFYKIANSETSRISQAVKEFKEKHNLPQNFEFHYHSNSKEIRALFIDLIKSFIIERVYHIKAISENRVVDYLWAFEKILTEIANDLSDKEISRVFFDKLGGETTESFLRTGVSRFCRDKNIKLKKPLTFVDSKKSDFIQIADYLVAMMDKGL